MSAVHTPAVLGRRACALLAAASATLHVFMLTHAGSVVAAGLLAVMILACLWCARDLWRRGTPGVWCTVALMNLAMVALHTPMPAHHHHGTAVSGHSGLMMFTVLLALTEAAIAGTVLYYRTRNRSVST
ncbi:hypothetical protein [Mycolicibacterium goodii]|uniref:Integral membrane protein n=1 Tax=Mycolicibacterium goodii TaxID=134601 RepID=A0ABS6HZJ0_MYCGD|nr:hypothetical protein [Mycolicibacterium goodii]OKH67816.1 hypothetical protein EB74_00970 [Mycobacterium sp. SWH-M5]MBU8819114.1 hypothetical protein [Mycolicibacterium goodii]MBU8826910.1 hypothetical protein [Mycolicibacterium goodii]MBU8829292.1 hypothetical protein [Mycolicibacterium goodii]MBU8836277.1 hypothetical protein [Mycolicibacterium goodii]